MKYNKLIICLITFLIGVLIYKIKNINRTERFETTKKVYSPGCYIFTRNCNDNEYWREKSTGEWFNDKVETLPSNSKEGCDNKRDAIKQKCGDRSYVRNMYVKRPNTTEEPTDAPTEAPETTKKVYSPGCYIFTRNCNDNNYWKENSTGEWYNDEVDGYAPINSKEECNNKETNIKQKCGDRAYVRNMYVKRPNTTDAPTDAPIETGCKDTNEQCADWAKDGECKNNPAYMLPNCAKSCNMCGPKETPKCFNLYNGSWILNREEIKTDFENNTTTQERMEFIDNIVKPAYDERKREFPKEFDYGEYYYRFKLRPPGVKNIEECKDLTLEMNYNFFSYNKGYKQCDIRYLYPSTLEFIKNEYKNVKEDTSWEHGTVHTHNTNITNFSENCINYITNEINELPKVKTSEITPNNSKIYKI